MNHYPHHIGDFNTATRHLSRLERAIYRDALELYYDKESPLDGSDFDRLAKRLLCRDADEIAALQFVLDEFFEQQDGGLWTHHRCDREIAKFKAAQADAGVVKSNEKQRQVRSRAERSAMFSALKAAGVAVKWNSRMGDLRALCAQHGIALAGPDSVTPSVTVPAVTGTVTVSQRHGSGTATQNQNHNHIKPPNPPAGGAGAAHEDSPGPGPEGQGGGVQEQQGGHVAQGVVGMPSAAAMTTATALGAFFPEKRRTRLVEVAQLVQSLQADGTVTSAVLLAAAASQASVLCRDDGKACPSMLRWLRESRWLDTALAPSQAQAIPANWRDTRSGVEAMGVHVGIGPWDSDKWRLFEAYEREVVAAVEAQAQGVAA